MILHVKQDDHSIPEIETHELYRTLSLSVVYDVYIYNLLKFIRFSTNDWFDKFYEPHISLQSYNTGNSCFNHLPVRLDVEYIQSIRCFNVAPAKLCVSMSDYPFKMNYKKVVSESYGP